MGDVAMMLRTLTEDKGIILTDEIIQEYLKENIELLVKEIKEEYLYDVKKV